MAWTVLSGDIDLGKDAAGETQIKLIGLCENSIKEDASRDLHSYLGRQRLGKS